jgi:hypothetical protein
MKLHHMDQSLIPLQLHNIMVGTRFERQLSDTKRSMIPCHETCKACQFITVITAPSPLKLKIFLAKTTPFTCYKFQRLARR